MSQVPPKPFGKQVFAIFALFFLAIIIVNSIFIYIAVESHTGIITQNPYEKGLKYNETLSKAKSQRHMHDSISYDDGILRWELVDTNGDSINTASVTVKLIRPVQDGYDFETTLNHITNGVYEADLDLPLTGQWEAHLKASWDETQFQTIYTFQNAQKK
ncbi:MAG: FixH family protein [Alcanivorax sp.]